MLSKLAFIFLMLLQPQQVADRVVAVVNGEPIMLSELRLTLPTGVEQRTDLPQLMRTNLEALINQELILQEIRRLKIFTVTNEEVAAGVNVVASGFTGGQEELEAELNSQGETLASLRESIRRRLLVLKYVDYRFRRFSEVEENRLLRFYEGEWADSFRAENPGAALPPLEEVRGELETLMIEMSVNDQLDAWLQDARSEARIAIKF